MIIITKNLELVPCNIEILTDAIAGNEKLALKLGVSIAENWNEFGSAIFQYTIDKLAESEDEMGWWIYFVIHKRDERLIGGGGYKGRPTAEGNVEIGYEIAPAYRNGGFATEVAKGLIEHAFSYSNVKCILAHTMAYENPSTKVLTKCGFVKTGEVQDPEDGLVWRWELIK